VVVGGADWTAEKADREHFFANGQGGFHVACPACEKPMASTFWKALEAWRAGGPRQFRCACGVVSDLSGLAYAPVAGFAAIWLRGAKAAGVELRPGAAAILEKLWPGVQVVGSRG